MNTYIFIVIVNYLTVSVLSFRGQDKQENVLGFVYAVSKPQLLKTALTLLNLGS